MSVLLAWSWLFTLPGLLLTAGLRTGRPGLTSLAGPAAIGLVALGWLLGGQPPAEVRFAGWLPFLPDGSFHLRVDPLAAVMLAVVGGVSTAIYVYSLGYLDGDPGQRRFFAYLDFFVASMALLVLAGNLAVLLIGWAGVGLASFLLISFWRDRPGTLTAGLQALAANAVGDAGLLLAAVLVPPDCGDLATLQTPACTAGPVGAGLLAALLVIAASAKSAQGPLYFWLPSAMAGPTPVSALIHAATMVAAGVYLLVRVSPLLALAPAVEAAVVVLGVTTAIGGGLASLLQSNFKRGLAYSTVSQLGIMFAAAGLGAPFAALFHLVTHASFKALLFLSAGVVIHEMDGQEELSRLGGLRRAIPWAYGGFLVGALALIGLPGTAGAFSKDAILEAGLHTQPVAGALLVAITFVTGLYIGRLFFGVFHGPAQHSSHARRLNGGSTLSTQHSGRVLRWPLVPLAIGALTLGYLEWPGRLLSHALEPLLGHGESISLVSSTGLLAGALGLAGFGLAGWWRQRGGARAEVWPASETAWVDRLAQFGHAVSSRVAAVHSGQLGRYLLVSMLGIAVILLIGLRA